MSNLTKKQIIILGAVATLIISVIGYYIYTISTKENYEEIDSISSNTAIKEKKQTDNKEETEEIIIHIAGQVKNPGIVKTKEGARIADIIELAGGLKEEADISNVNLAYIVEDGQKINIPIKGSNSKESEEYEEYITTKNGENIINQNEVIKESNVSKKSENNVIVNINKASQTELEQLQGIGPSTALKIIEYKKENGNFKTIEDVKNVSGIGEAKYNAIKNNISVK